MKTETETETKTNTSPADSPPQKRTISERSYETQLLVDRLSKVPEGDFLAYSDLSTIIGEKIDGSSSRLASARRVVQSESQIVFETIRGEGIKRADAPGVVRAANAGVEKIRRESRRRLKILGCTPIDKLDASEKAQFNMTASHLGILGEMCNPRAVKQLRIAVEAAQERLPVAKAIEAMQGK